MGQEYFINSQILEDKIRAILPSQGGAGAGFDLSASTQIIPVIDVTEAAEGSVLRQDLQTAQSFNSQTTFSTDSSITLISSTGYYSVKGTATLQTSASTGVGIAIRLLDGVSNKNIFSMFANATTTGIETFLLPFDLTVFIPAGGSLATTGATGSLLAGSFRQIATITGELVNPN
tara:strand:+ start:332 stop:856 length:525 start_codon:yes stop_codon:yes gene_type:complete